MAAYLKDIENNTRDMTADRIILEKKNRIETKDVGTRLYIFYYYFIVTLSRVLSRNLR